jgi:GH35 family endo-1,4-beta-xylanase
MTCIDLPFAEVPQKAADWAQAFLTPVFRDVSALKHFICWSTDDGKSWLNQYAPRTDDNPITGSNLMNSLYQWNPLKDGILNALSARPLV